MFFHNRAHQFEFHVRKNWVKRLLIIFLFITGLVVLGYSLVTEYSRVDNQPLVSPLVEDEAASTAKPEPEVKEKQDVKSELNIYDLTKMYANIYGVDKDLALCVLENESNGRCEAIGDGGLAHGPFQFHLPTWKSFRKQMGLNTLDLRTDPYESARTAMWAISKGYGPHWTPYYKCLAKAR